MGRMGERRGGRGAHLLARERRVLVLDRRDVRHLRRPRRLLMRSSDTRDGVTRVRSSATASSTTTDRRTLPSLVDVGSGGARRARSTRTPLAARPSRASSSPRSTRPRSGARASRTSAAATRASRRAPSQRRLRAGLRRRPAGAVPQGRGHAAHRRARAAPIAIRSRLRPGTSPSPRSASSSATAASSSGYTIGNDVSSRDIEGANPLYLPRRRSTRRLRDRAGGLRAATDARRRRFEITLRITRRRRRRRSSPGRRRRLACARTFADLVAAGSCATTPCPPGQRAAHRYRSRPSRRLHPAARPRRRDPRARDRHAAQPRRPCLRAARKEHPMTETAHRRPARNYVGGEWRESLSGETLREAKPLAPVRGDRRVRRVRRRRRRAAVDAAREAFAGLGRAARRGSGRPSSPRQPMRSRPAPSGSRRT